MGNRPHVFLLGAGASRAAFPDGDKYGRKLPVMKDFVECIGLQDIFDSTDEECDKAHDFEELYSDLKNNRSKHDLVIKVERRINEYFENLELPDSATIYDRLLLSMREKDVIITFNWDPFLFDSVDRNSRVASLPEIFFLHGNVRIGFCLADGTWGRRWARCPNCGHRFHDVPLLYPIKEKNYSDSPYIRRAWDAAKIRLQEAFTLTIFGYGAPKSDSDAIELLKEAWFSRSNRRLEHIEIIDIDEPSRLHETWSHFTPTLHYDIVKEFNESRVSRWPRRSCESLNYSMLQGLPCEDFRLPETDDIFALQEHVKGKLAQFENATEE